MVKTQTSENTEQKYLPTWIKILIVVIVIMIIADVIYILTKNFKKSSNVTSSAFINEPIIWRR
jgi:uncharacterized membrane protein YdbT with pleckstrin-like domain